MYFELIVIKILENHVLKYENNAKFQCEKID